MNLIKQIFIIFGYLLFIPLLSLAAPMKEGVKLGDSKSIELNESGVAAMKSKDFVTAEENFKKALSANKQNITAAYNLAGAYILNKKEGDAITFLKGYLADYNQDAGLWVRLGDAQLSQAKPKEAITSYHKARALAPQYAGLSKRIASTYTLIGDFAAAEQYYLEVVKATPQDLESLTNLSSIFLAREKPDMAISSAKRAIQIKPSSQLYSTLAGAYESRKEWGNAIISLEKAIALGDVTENTKKRLTNLKNRGK